MHIYVILFILIREILVDGKILKNEIDIHTYIRNYIYIKIWVISNQTKLLAT